MSLQLILKHSSVSGKAPTAAQLAEGEISLNLHADGPFLCCKDTAGDVVQLGGVTISATAPTTTKSAFWLDTSGTDPVLKVYDGSTWKSTSVVPTMTSIAGTAPVTASTTGGVATIGISDASQTAKGAVQLATAAETTTGTSATKAVHPAGLKVELDKKASLASPPFTGTPTAPTAAAGTKTTQLATTEFVDAAIAAAQPDASETVKGIAELATQAETTTGTDDTRIVTPKKLKVELDKKVDEAPDGTANGTIQYNRQVVTAGSTQTKTWVKADTGLADAPDGSAAGSKKYVRQVTAADDGSGGFTQSKSWAEETLYPEPPDGTADGTVQYARQVVTAGTGGTPTNTKTWAKVEGVWKRTGTELSPTTAGDSVFTTGSVKVGGTTAAPLAKIDGSTGAATAADVTVTNVKSAMALATDSTGKIIPAAAPFTWDANDDSYVRVPVADRDINVQARMRRCLVTDAGVVTYLDADDSTKLAGDWLRLCETTELHTAYTSTHGYEVQNTLLRALAPAWSAGTFAKGALVTNGGSVWECIAATTTATPAAGTAAATLDGTAGQVMVEIPTFSVYHRGDVVGKHCRHQWAVSLGAAQGGGYVTHPAFVKPDGSIRKAIYIGAYQGTGANGNGSASGVNNTTNMTRANCRTACAGRGTGWHQLGYAEYNAVQLLLLTEYQDLNSQKVLGNGATTGTTHVVNTGLSNARGNRSENVHAPAGANTDYVSYRGVENIYGRAWQWADGINVNERAIYVCTDPSKWADDTAADYDVAGVVPAGSKSYIRDVFSAGTYLLPRSVDGGSGTTYVGDALWTRTYSGWHVAAVGGFASHGAQAGALCVDLRYVSSDRYTSYAGRLAFAQ